MQCLLYLTKWGEIMKWVHKIDKLKFDVGKNIDEMMKQKEYIKRDEVGIIHSKNGAGLVVKDDGSIQCFSDYGLGFEINKKTKSIHLYASKMKIFCDEWKIIDDSNGIEASDEVWREIEEVRKEEEA